MLILALLAACPNEGGMTSATMTNASDTSTGQSGESSSGSGEPGTAGTTGGSATTGDTSSTGSSTGAIAECTPGATEACYSGPPGTQDVGLCVAGERTCDDDGTWGACAGEVLPAAEDCGSPGDEDCDGVEACAGKFPWSKSYGGIEWEETRGVGFDGAGNVVVMVRASGKSALEFGGDELLGGGGMDLSLAKFAPDGTHLWSQRFVAVFPEYINPAGLAVHPDGRIAVTGRFDATVDFGAGPIIANSEGDGFIAVFGPDGAALWSEPLRAGSQMDPLAVAFDAAGGVAVSGFVLSGWIDLGGGALHGHGYDGFAGKFDAAGEHVWSTRFGDLDKQYGFAVASDAAGNTYVGGHFEGDIDLGGGPLSSVNAYSDVFVGAFAPDGALLWDRSWGGTSEDYIHTIALDGNGRMALLGSAGGSIDLGGGPLVTEQYYREFIAVLDLTGEHVWSRSLPGGAGVSDIAYDGTGSLVATGELLGSVDFGGGPLIEQGGRDIFALKLTTDGDHVWSARFGDSAQQLPMSVAGSTAGVVALGGRYSGVVDFGDGPLPAADMFGTAYVAVLAP